MTAFVLALHSHLPYAAPPRWPHGGVWLFEAVVDSSLLLLEAHRPAHHRHHAGARHCDDADALVAALRPDATTDALSQALARVTELQSRDRGFPDILDSLARVLA
jgi:hypothetical protein